MGLAIHKEYPVIAALDRQSELTGSIGQLDVTSGKRNGAARKKHRRLSSNGTGVRQAILSTLLTTIGLTCPPSGHTLAESPSATPGDHETIQQFDSSRFTQSGSDRSGNATPAHALRLPSGFRAELLYTVPLDEQGSWVCLTIDDQGRLITSAQFGGLYRVTLPRPGNEPEGVRVELLDVGVGCAQGLLWACDSLYVVGRPLDGPLQDAAVGLYRLRDTDGDDHFDSVRLLLRFDENHDEHGPHAVVLGPDGASLYLIGGNMCFPDPPPKTSRFPGRPGIDRLAGGIDASPGLWQPNRVGGWVCRCGPDGEDLELIALGLRNAYDLAFNAAGDLLTFDSDMEWDAGMPWYRPTRVNHVVSGADFGWRPDSSKWPDFYPDSVGSVVDIGFSSPTGITFGYGAKFPLKYQEAMLVGDWSMGLVYAVTLEQHGASYTGAVERLVSGVPLPVTDLVVNPVDGRLYFTVGGRGVTSALYCVEYVGDEPTTPVAPAINASPDRSARLRMEALHNRIGAAAVEQAWPYLSHSDRAVRYAARIAVEHQPADSWINRALNENEPRRSIAAMIALARCGNRELQSAIVDSLTRIDWKSISADDANDLSRAYNLVVSRMGSPTGNARDRIVRHLLPAFPHGDSRVDLQLAEVLCYLEAPDAIDRTLTLLENSPTQEEQVHYATCLCTLENGWTTSKQRRLLTWFRNAKALRGGVSFEGSLTNIERMFLQRLSSDDRMQFADLLAEQPVPDPYSVVASRRHVKAWTVDDLLKLVNDNTQSRDPDNGKKIFSDSMCFRCHRFQGQGGITGPDLTTVGRRFNARDILEAIIEPNRVISDQYRGVTILTSDGKVVSGKINNQSGNTLLLMKDALNPADLVMIKRDQVDEIWPAQVSMMPSGLLDTFSGDEILDLLAFLMRSADRDEAKAN